MPTSAKKPGDSGTGTKKNPVVANTPGFRSCRRKLFLLRSADRGANLRFAAFEVGLAATAFLNLVKLLSHFNS